VSIVMPCLNEADTVGLCVETALRALRENGVSGEVIVADNGSTDNSRILAAERGARVIPVAAKGYGHALAAGIAAARGRFVVMGDSDCSYDFLELPKFLVRLREGYSLVQGCRLPSGGGTIMARAMPVLHRWWGNPMLSWMARTFFRTPIHDVYCGMRGFTQTLVERLNLRCTGMEFATEMIVKASLYGERIAEVPITLHPDRRKAHAPHLKTFRDGWRTLRFFLTYSPRWLFWYPGFVLVFLGLLGYAVAFPRMRIAGIVFDAHTLLFASLAILLGHQSLFFAIFTKVFAISEHLLPDDARVNRFFRIATLERGLVLGVVGCLAGISLLGWAVWQWKQARFGPLDYPSTMRLVIPGVTLTALGFQTILSSFFVSILGLSRR